MILRELNKSDHLDDLVRLSKAFFTEYQACNKTSFALDDLNNDQAKDYFSSFIGEEDRIIGHITISIKKQSPHWKGKGLGRISGLMVEQECRRSGIATRLLTEAKHYFAELGIKYFTISTSVNYHSGVVFYRSRGVEPLHTQFMGQVGTGI